jgi:glutamine synthetase
MSNEEILDYVSKHPSGRVKVAVADIDGVLRGKYISSEKFLSVAKSELGFCAVIFGWDMADQAYDNSSYTGWHTGYPDAKVKLSLNSFR